MNLSISRIKPNFLALHIFYVQDSYSIMNKLKHHRFVISPRLIPISGLREINRSSLCSRKFPFFAAPLLLDRAWVGVTADRGTRGREVPGSELAWANWFLPQARKLFGIARWSTSLGMLTGPSPHHCSPIGRAPLPSRVKTSTWCFQRRRKLQSRQ